MTKTMNEEKVLKKLNIEDFRFLTKDHVIKLASMADRIDPEVMKKALEQFPEFSNATKEVVGINKDTLEKAFNENAKSVEDYYDVCKSLISTLQVQLEKDDLSFEQKQEIIKEMLEIHERMGLKDSENKAFILKMVGIGATVLGGTIITMFAVLSGKVDVDFPAINKN